MKHLITILSLFTLHSSLFAVFAVPLRWTVETSRAVPATFEAYQGETLELEAALQSYGKPLEAPANYALYWQTNGMGNAYWSAPIDPTSYLLPPTSNLLRATWRPECDVGAKAYTCFIGAPGTIYHAAFQLRLRPSPGATPNELPLPQKTIDFATVEVLNPDAAPWASTNAVQAAARPLPKYLHALDFDDSYPDAAAEYYRSRGDGKTDGGCSAVRDGGFLCRNFDFPFDDRAEFVVKMSAGPGRFASVGVAQVGTNLTEQIVTSGKPSRCYKWLPGATVDGVNANGVAVNVNVVGGDPMTNGWLNVGDIHPLGAVRWVLDHATDALDAATNLALRVKFPDGWTQNFHWMVCDEGATYIVENGNYSNVTGRAVMTNFRLDPWDDGGEGHERYDALMGGANITSQWWTLTYTASGYRASDLPGITGEDLANLFNYWENNPRESHRGEVVVGQPWWQSIHTSVYDITNRTVRVAVQETDDWYTFAVPVAGGVKPEAVREIVQPMLDPVSNIAVSAQQTADEATRSVGALADDVTAAQTAASTAQQTADEATRLVGALADDVARAVTNYQPTVQFGADGEGADTEPVPGMVQIGGSWTGDHGGSGTVKLGGRGGDLGGAGAVHVGGNANGIAGDGTITIGGTGYFGGDGTLAVGGESDVFDGSDGTGKIIVRAPSSGTLTITHTGDASETLTERIVRDAGTAEVAARAVTQPEGSAEPDDYRVQIGHGATATGPAGAGADSAGRNQSIAIGYNATATNWTSVAIGSGGWSEYANALGVVTGRVTNAATADGREAVAIGYGARAHGNMSTAVGKLAWAHGDYSAAFGAQSVAGQHGVAIGFGADAATHGMQRAIAIGRYASANAENSVQLFTGTNDVANSIKIGNTFVWSGGHPANEDDPRFKTFTNSLFKVDPVRFNAAIGHSAAVVTTEGTTTNTSSVAIGRSARVDPAYGDAQASVAIGMQTRSANISSITIGHSSSNYGKRSIAIGRDIVISNDLEQANMDAIAVGYQAKVYRQQGIAIGKTAVVDGSGAVQIGTGENTVANSLKFRNTTVVGGDGKVPFASLAGAYSEASGNQLSAQVATIGAHLNAEDARFVATNYNSATHMPEASVEVKLPDQTWSTVWREMTRWNWLTGEFLPASYASKADLDEKADRAWGFYDSHAGTWAPDGYTWISSPRIAVSGGLAYQRTITTEGAVWVLESNGMVAETGGATNGFFRISDDEGNTQFEIVKGDRRTVGADANGVETLAGFSPTRLRIVYSVVAEAHPTISVCTDLVAGVWVAEDDADCPATVTWSGASGAYVAQVQGKTALPALFVKATYQTGGETYIRNAAPVSMTHVVIGGAKYAVGTATISGHTVMTLTPAP